MMHVTIPGIARPTSSQMSKDHGSGNPAPRGGRCSAVHEEVCHVKKWQQPNKQDKQTSRDSARSFPGCRPFGFSTLANTGFYRFIVPSAALDGGLQLGAPDLNLVIETCASRRCR